MLPFIYIIFIVTRQRLVSIKQFTTCAVADDTEISKQIFLVVNDLHPYRTLGFATCFLTRNSNRSGIVYYYRTNRAIL